MEFDTMTHTFINVDGTTVDAATHAQPSDREFRGAWELDNDVIVVDMPKARVIYADNLRVERDALFPDLDRDVDALRIAAELNGGTLDAQQKIDMQAVEDKRIQLRDAPTHASIAAATTPAELQALDLLTFA